MICLPTDLFGLLQTSQDKKILPPIKTSPSTTSETRVTTTITFRRTCHASNISTTYCCMVLLRSEFIAHSEPLSTQSVLTYGVIHIFQKLILAYQVKSDLYASLVSAINFACFSLKVT